MAQPLTIVKVRAEITPTLDAVGRDVRAAIALSEVHRPISFDPKTIAKFDNTFAAHVIMLARDNLALSAIAALARIWDKACDAQSAPALGALLKRDGVLDVIVEDRRQQMMNITTHGPLIQEAEQDADVARLIAEMARRDGDEAEMLVRDTAAAVLTKIEDFPESRLGVSLRAARDRLIAHSLKVTREERAANAAGRPIESLKRGEIEEIIEFTVDVFTDLEGVFRGSHPNLPSFRDVWSRYSEDFWNRW